MLKCLTDLAYNNQSQSLQSPKITVYPVSLSHVCSLRQPLRQEAECCRALVYIPPTTGGLALRANMMSILTSAEVISAKVITDWPRWGVTGTKVVQNLSASRNPVTPTERCHRSRNQSGSEFHERSKSGDSPRGEGKGGRGLVRDPEIKSVGNLLKRVDPQTKLVYGHGKCPKNTKNDHGSTCPSELQGI